MPLLFQYKHSSTMVPFGKTLLVDFFHALINTSHVQRVSCLLGKHQTLNFQVFSPCRWNLTPNHMKLHLTFRMEQLFWLLLCVCEEHSIYSDPMLSFPFFHPISHMYALRASVILYDSLINHKRTNRSSAETWVADIGDSPQSLLSPRKISDPRRPQFLQSF